MITNELGFTSTVHKACLYYILHNKDDNISQSVEDDNITLILQQVDDFLVANKDSNRSAIDKSTESILKQKKRRKFNGAM